MRTIKSIIRGLGRKGRTKINADQWRRLTRSEPGYSATSRKYVRKSVKKTTEHTPTLSVRQYQQAKSGVTLENKAKQYHAGERQRRTAADEEGVIKATRARASTNSLKRRFGGEKIERIRQHQEFIAEKEAGNWFDQDEWLREKAFAEAHRDDPQTADEIIRFFNYGKSANTEFNRTHATAENRPNRRRAA